MKRRLAIKALLSTPAITAVPLPAQTSQTARPADEIPTLTTATADAVGDAVPRYFSPAQIAALRKLGDLMIPAAPGRAGAREAKAADFLDFLISQAPPDRQSLYRNGLDRLQSEARRLHSTTFEDLTTQQADAVLAPLHAAWTYAAPPDAFARFLRAAKDDLLTATFNSREFAEAQAAAGRRASGMGTYWYPIE